MHDGLIPKAIDLLTSEFGSSMSVNAQLHEIQSKKSPLLHYVWVIDQAISVRSRWLDIGQVLFLRVYGPRRSRGP